MSDMAGNEIYAPLRRSPTAIPAGRPEYEFRSVFAVPFLHAAIDQKCHFFSGFSD